MPRSIVAWFAVCWALFLVAALVVGALLIALYKETTTQRTDRAATSIARACEAIVRETDSLGPAARTKADYASAVDHALGGVLSAIYLLAYVSLGAVSLLLGAVATAHGLGFAVNLGAGVISLFSVITVALVAMTRPGSVLIDTPPKSEDDT